MTLSRAHALTAAELALLRTRAPAARTDLFLAIWPMFQGVKGDPFNAIVWTGLVDEPGGITDDRLFEIDYDNGSGAGDFGLTLPDMTVYVGTAAGSDDLGRARLRGWAAGSTGVAGTMLLGEMSEIVWWDNAFLTVVDDFNLWPRHIYIDSNGVIYMDHGYYDEVAAANVDGSYTDQHRYPDPTPVLGPDAIAWMPATGNVRIYFDASNSFTLDGGALTYAWAFPGSVANGGLAVAATWADYNAADVYRADCTVSRNYPPVATFTGHRRLWVFDEDNMPTVKFSFQDCAGDYGAGGWSYRVQMWDEARLSEIVDRARCVLFARDWFDGVEQSVGPLTTDQHGGMTLRANVVCSAWIAGESIVWDNEKGSVTFDVQGPKHWFEQMPGFPHGVENSDGVPTGWFQFQGGTVRDGLWSFLHWRSTATRMMDIELTGDTREIAVFSTPIGSLWAQLVAGSFPAILAPPVCDRYGSLIVEIPLNWEFTASRAGTPTVLAMSLSDWRDQIDITRRIVSPRSMTDLSGVHYTDSTTAAAFFALAYGHIFGRYGKIARQERLALFAAQATNNSLSGLVQAAAVMEYPTVDYRLAGNYRVFDIVPRQRITQSIVAGDTERGLVWTNKLLLPRSVSFAMADGVLLADMTCEEETGEASAITGEPPPTTPTPPPLPPLPPLPPIEPTPEVAYGVVVMNQDQLAISFDFFDGVPNWYDLSDGGATLAGVYQNIAVRGIEAWLTTRDDANMATTGLFYCADITQAIAGVPVWTLIKSATDAANDTGYTTITPNRCHLGSLWMRDDGDICAMIHSEGNNSPAPGQSGVYIGSAGVVAISLLPFITGNPIYQEQGFAGTNHCVWGGAGSFYVAGRTATAGQRAVVHAVGGATIDFDPPDNFNVVTAHNGYVQTWNIIVVPPNSNVFGGAAWNPALSESLVIQSRAGMTVVTDYQAGTTTPYMYSANDGLYDLYVSGGVGMVGDASVEFGVGREGSYAEFFPFDTQQIAWLLGTAAAFAVGNTVLYTDDQGATWVVKDGAGGTSLQNALGGVANWSGWSNAGTDNSLTRIFPY